MTAIVEKIDVAQRLVTLRGPNGKSKTIRVSDEARNLAQVEPGDEVAVTYYESIAYQVLAPGEKKPGISAEGGAGRAELGDKPGGLAAQAVTLVADVEELDRANQVAVLRGPEDQMITVNVQRPEVFDKVKVGDRVEITYTEAIAVDVQPKSAK
jgi:ribosomal 50S subunit-recycling heat shock protein